MFVLALAVIAFQDLAALEAQAATVAGQPVTIDRRLRLAACGHPAIVPVAAGLAVACADPAWRIVVPLAARVAVPLVRRGDAVSVDASGPGFVVSIEGVAEADAAAGARLRVRDRTGGHLTAIVRADGSVAASGYNVP